MINSQKKNSDIFPKLNDNFRKNPKKTDRRSKRFIIGNNNNVLRQKLIIVIFKIPFMYTNKKIKPGDVLRYFLFGNMIKLLHDIDFQLQRLLQSIVNVFHQVHNIFFHYIDFQLYRHLFAIGYVLQPAHKIFLHNINFQLYVLLKSIVYPLEPANQVNVMK